MRDETAALDALHDTRSLSLEVSLNHSYIRVTREQLTKLGNGISKPITASP
jgi:hypothetical protein